MRTSAKTALACLCLAILTMGGPAVAEPLGSDQIKQLIGGKKVFLSTPLRIELPLIYRNDGSVVGNISGFSMASMFTPSESGRWWVENDKLCQKWPTWYKGKQFCFKIVQTGPNKIAWTRDDNYSGTARIAN
jgi:hypothetical protein